MQIRKLANSFANLCLLSSLCMSLMSFKGEKNSDSGDPLSGDPKKADSVSLAKNAKSLFANSLISEITIKIPLNSHVKLFATNFMDRQSECYDHMKVWGKSYFSLFDRILTEYNVPVQLKYLAVVESNLSCNSKSCVGAAGPWQLMASVARSYGLRTGKVDDRKNYAKSTKVAAQMLSRLYSSLGDWLLVIAAYNAGEGRVRQAMRKADSENFWAIQKYLPAETRNHVKKYIAAHYYFEGNGGITTMTADEIENSQTLTSLLLHQGLKNGTIKSVEIQGKYNSTLMAKYLQMDEDYLLNLNPGLEESLKTGNNYKLNLPSDKVKLFSQSRAQILKESVQLLMINSTLPAR